MLTNIVYENTLDGIISAYLLYQQYQNGNGIKLSPYQRGIETQGDQVFIVGDIDYDDLKRLSENHEVCVYFSDYHTSVPYTNIVKEFTYSMTVWHYINDRFSSRNTPVGLLAIDDFYGNKDHFAHIHELAKYERSAYHKVLWGIVSGSENINDMQVIYEMPEEIMTTGSGMIIKGMVASAKETAFPVHFFGKKAIVLETQFRERTMFDDIPEEYDFYIAYTRVDRNLFKVQMFSDKHDCNIYSKKLGGYNGFFITRNIERLWN